MAIECGCVSVERAQWFARREEARNRIDAALALEVGPSEMRGRGFSATDDVGRQALRDWTRFPGFEISRLVEAGLVPRETDRELLSETAEDLHYAPYVARQDAELREVRANERVALPPDLPFAAVPGLSNEMIERLTASHPETLAQAARVPGVTPAALTALLIYVRKMHIAA